MFRLAFRCVPVLFASLLGVGLSAQQATAATADTHHTVVVRHSASPLRHVGAPSVRYRVATTKVEVASARTARRAAATKLDRALPLRR